MFSKGLDTKFLFICSCRSCNPNITTWKFLWPQWSLQCWDQVESPACPERPHMALILGQPCLKRSVCCCSVLWVASGSPWAVLSVPVPTSVACCLGSAVGQQLLSPHKNICLGHLSSDLILALGLLRPISASAVVWFPGWTKDIMSPLPYRLRC